MEYGRLPKPQPGLGPSSSSSNSHLQTTTTTTTTTKFAFHRPNSKLKLLLIVAGALLLASAISAVLVLVIRSSSRPGSGLKPSQAMSRTCSRTQYPTLCLNSLLEFPGALTASDQELVHISVNITLNRVGSALYSASEITNLDMDPHIRSAYEDCLELLEDSVSLLDRSLTSINPQEGTGIGGSREEDVVTWLSASLTNQDTCTQGLDEVKEGEVKKQMWERVQDLSELVSNSLAIYSTSSSSGDSGLGGVPIIQNRRKLMGDEEFPKWVSRALLDVAATSINADVVVSKDGNGSCKTIGEAIKKAPDHGNRRFIIYVRAGRYEENNLKVGRKKTNVMLIGDGKGKTVISGGKSVQDKLTTFHTASFAATGSGFIARDITFENWAGPAKHQAVALRVGADHAVIYRCNIIGYQDTLYTHSQRQFYRECDIYGTVDFIFGNAAVVFQNCTIHARKPLPQQKNTITAQNRKDPNQNTGISIHACRLVAEAELEPARGEYPTYLGRPWKMYARTVYMQSYLGDHIHPQGWLEWNTSRFALDTLYYGEYMNYGPGAGLTHRVNWPGYRVIKSATEAGKFTVAQFIYGSSWLPATGVAFLAGLST